MREGMHGSGGRYSDELGVALDALSLSGAILAQGPVSPRAATDFHTNYQRYLHLKQVPPPTIAFERRISSIGTLPSTPIYIEDEIEETHRRLEAIRNEQQRTIQLPDSNIREALRQRRLRMFPSDAQDLLRQLRKDVVANPGVEVYHKALYVMNYGDLRTLLGREWLNDEIINNMIKLFKLRDEQYGNPSHPSYYHHRQLRCYHNYYFSTFFYSKLGSGGHAQVKRWTKSTNLFSYDRLLIPLHLGAHWCVGMVDITQCQLSYFDSLSGSPISFFSTIKAYLQAEYDRLEGEGVTELPSLAIEDWKEKVGNCPQQQNGYDCGVFTLCCIDTLAMRDKRFQYHQHDMPYMRQRIMLDLVAGHTYVLS